MGKWTEKIRHGLTFKLVVAAGAILLVSLTLWSSSNARRQQAIMAEILAGPTDRLAAVLERGVRYTMMTNGLDELRQIIRDAGQEPDVRQVRLISHTGRVMFAARQPDNSELVEKTSASCAVCHAALPPRTEPGSTGSRITLMPGDGGRVLSVVRPIYNEAGCSTAQCHQHPASQDILGVLDISVSLDRHDRMAAAAARSGYWGGIAVLLLTAGAIFLVVGFFVGRPVEKLIAGMRRLAETDDFTPVHIRQNDEIGRLAETVNQMGWKISGKQKLLNRQRDEYQVLFESVPCILTVHDRNMRLVKYNRVFADKFKPEDNDFCYRAYKGLSEKCINCPVELTFQDGKSHYSEEKAVRADGSFRYWAVHTSPLFGEDGEVEAAVEVCLDITPRKQLEEDLQRSEKKYYAIFNNIPNPVFVLDADTLEVLDCNERVYAVYGYRKAEMIDRSFLDLFVEQERDQYALTIKNASSVNTARQVNKDGDTIYVNMRISPSEYPGQKVYLVTTSDITKRLETEQQLIQASKMATLGEMATGVAHELNQPLTVIKTASNFFMKKVKHQEPIRDDILFSFAEEIDQHVDRASRIINHMREFGRKSNMNRESVQANQVVQKAFDLFSQQLKLREIEVAWELAENLPDILADAGRLEQVFINLLVNARDAIEEQWARAPRPEGKQIVLETRLKDGRVVVRVSDNGIGIPNAISKKIFEPFFTTKDVGKGTGLGLSISYGFIKDCGGDIHAEPNPEGGASFILDFPAYVRRDDDEDHVFEKKQDDHAGQENASDGGTLGPANA